MEIFPTGCVSSERQLVSDESNQLRNGAADACEAHLIDSAFRCRRGKVYQK